MDGGQKQKTKDSCFEASEESIFRQKIGSAFSSKKVTSCSVFANTENSVWCVLNSGCSSESLSFWKH
jgi:hypothetical protein